jgi:hypothetical protein
MILLNLEIKNKMAETFRSEYPQIAHDTLGQMSSDDIEKFFAGSNIPCEDIGLDDLPVSILETLDKQTQRGRDGRPFSELFDTVSSIQFPDGSTTYFASYLRSDNNVPDEKVVKVIDTTASETVAGDGTIVFYLPTNTSIVSGARHKMIGFPFVGTTDTLPEHRQQGLGARRLFAMNYISRKIFGLPLYSGLQPTPQAKSLWDTLVQEELATPPTEESHNRYRFI